MPRARRDGLGTPAAVHGLRPRRVLRLEPAPARVSAPREQWTPGDAFLRAGRKLVVVLRGRNDGLTRPNTAFRRFCPLLRISLSLQSNVTQHGVVVSLSYLMRPTHERVAPHAANGAAAPRDPNRVQLRRPNVSDGTRMWEVARDSQVLDLNSSYSYVLWCRDFADTSIVALDEGRVVGFVTGYLRPGRTDTLFVWQVAVDADQRGKGAAGRMLDGLLDGLADQGVTRLETTISPDNAASQALFTALARRRGTDIVRQDLFAPEHFPDSHEAEDLYIVGHNNGGRQ